MGTWLCSIAWRAGRPRCVPTTRGSHSQPILESLWCWREESGRTSDPGGAVRFSSWSWNPGQALYLMCCVFWGLGVSLVPCGVLWKELWEHGGGIRPVFKGRISRCTQGSEHFLFSWLRVFFFFILLYPDEQLLLYSLNFFLCVFLQQILNV